MDDIPNDSEKEVTTIAVCYGRAEAAVVQSRLADAGVDSYLRGETAACLYGVNVDGLARTEIVVASADAEVAREILRQRETDAGQPEPK